MLRFLKNESFIDRDFRQNPNEQMVKAGITAGRDDYMQVVRKLTTALKGNLDDLIST